MRTRRIFLRTRTPGKGPGRDGGSIRAALGIAAASLMLAPAANALRLCLHPARVPFEADDERTVRIERTLAEHFERAGIAVVRTWRG